MNKKYIASAVVIAIILVALYSLQPQPQPLTTGENIVYISPISQSVSLLDNFSINISCIPDQPIKAFEFEIYYNSSIIQATSVNKGNIFDNYDTFLDFDEINQSNICIIDNENGSIIHIYNLIIGQGNVTEEGTLMTINFISVGLGTSEINLSGVGVTNETQYLPLIVYNGSVQIEEETIVYAMMINASWSLISWPMPDMIPKENITVLYNNTFYTFQEACDIIIVPFIFMWNGLVYVETDYFYPYFGYWIYSYHDEVILIYENG